MAAQQPIVLHANGAEACRLPLGLAGFLMLGARTLVGAPGIATRSKDAIRGSWPYY